MVFVVWFVFLFVCLLLNMARHEDAHGAMHILIGTTYDLGCRRYTKSHSSYTHTQVSARGGRWPRQGSRVLRLCPREVRSAERLDHSGSMPPAYAPLPHVASQIERHNYSEFQDNDHTALNSNHPPSEHKSLCNCIGSLSWLYYTIIASPPYICLKHPSSQKSSNFMYSLTINL